jgi:hypothetical protein
VPMIHPTARCFAPDSSSKIVGRHAVADQTGLGGFAGRTAITDRTRKTRAASTTI